MRQMTTVLIGEVLNIYFSNLGFECEGDLYVFATLLDPEHNDIERIRTFVDGEMIDEYVIEAFYKK